MTKHKYTEESIRKAVAKSFSYAGVLRELNIPQAGGNQTHLKKRIIDHQIDTSHFTHKSWCKGKRSPYRYPPEQILVLKPEGSNRTDGSRLRSAMIDSGVKYECEQCSLESIWNGKVITLEVDHINGSWLDNRLKNLRFLCPNCHSQQDTNKGWRNYVSTKREKVTAPKVLKSKIENFCSCGKKISDEATTCKSCVPRPSVIDWPSQQEVRELVELTNYVQAGKILGVSDNAVRKYLKRNAGVVERDTRLV